MKYVSRYEVIFVSTCFLAASFENTSEMMDFVRCKIESLVANNSTDRPKEGMG